MKKNWVFFGIIASSVPYAYTMISYLDALTPLSLTNILLSSILWPITVASLISIIDSKLLSFLTGFVLILAQCVLLLIAKFYHDYFVDLPHVEMLLHQSNEGTEVLGMIFDQVMKQSDWLVLACALAGAIILPLKIPTSIPMRKALKPFITSITVLFALWTFVFVRKINFNDRCIYFVRYGLIATASAQTWDIIKPKREVKPEKPEFEELEGQISGNLNNFRFDHVFILQLESLDPELIGKSVNGVPVTPFLSKLIKECTVFSNFYSQHGGGGSSDAELASLSGLFALASHGGLSTANHEWLTSLPEQLASNAIDSFFFHPNSSTYYDRSSNLKKMGFKKTFFNKDFSNSSRGWEASDAYFFKESLDLLQKEKPDRFLAYLVTIQSHGPFNRHKLPNPFPENNEVSVKDNYVRAIYELDHAVKTFFERLENSPWKKNTAVILYSDHLSSVYQAKEDRREKIFSSICGIGKQKQLEPNLGSHTDISSTVTDLFKIQASPNWVGTSLLRTVNSRFTFLVRPPFIGQTGSRNPQPLSETPKMKQLLEYSNSILWP